MKFAQSVELVKLLKEFDENHYFRKINIKKFVKQNSIKHHFVGPVMLIDKEDFFKKINPTNIKKSYKIPKIRTMASTVREYNKNELDKINTHTIFCKRCDVKINIHYLQGEYRSIYYVQIFLSDNDGNTAEKIYRFQ